MAPAMKERLNQIQEIQCNLSKVQSEKECFEENAALCRQEAVTRLQEALIRVQEARTGVQEAVLAQEARKLAEEATARAQRVDILARQAEALVQEAKKLAAHFEGKVVSFSTTDEAKMLADLKKEYQISVRGTISIKLERGEARAYLHAFAKSLNILD